MSEKFIPQEFLTNEGVEQIDSPDFVEREIKNNKEIDIGGENYEVRTKEVVFSEKIYKETGGVSGYKKYSVNISPEQLIEKYKYEWKECLDSICNQIESTPFNRGGAYHFQNGVYSGPNHTKFREERGLLQKPFDLQRAIVSNPDLLYSSDSNRDPSWGYTVVDSELNSFDLWEDVEKQFPNTKIFDWGKDWILDGGPNELKSEMYISHMINLQKEGWEQEGIDGFNKAKEYLTKLISDKTIIYSANGGTEMMGLYLTTGFAGGAGFSAPNKLEKNVFVFSNEQNSSFASYIENVVPILKNSNHPTLKNIWYNFKSFIGEKGPYNPEDQVVPVVFSEKTHPLRWCLADTIYIPSKDKINIIRTKSTPTK